MTMLYKLKHYLLKWLNVATANTYSNVSANRLIRVCGNGSITITVGSLANVGATATQIPIVKNSSFIIKKLDNE